MTKHTKNFRRETADRWVQQILNQTSGAHILNETRIGFSIETELDKLTGKQLKLINSLMAAAYGKGCNDTRECFKMLDRHRNPAPVLKLVQS